MRRERVVWRGPKRLLLVHHLYDLLDRVVEERLEDAAKKVLHLTRYAYDEAGDKIFEQVGEQITRTEYNPFGEPITIINALDEVTHIEYDRLYLNGHGQRVLKKTTTDPLGTQTVEIYDAANRLVKISSINPFGQMISCQERQLDLCGNPFRLVDFQMEGAEVKKYIITERAFSLMDEETTLIEAWGTPEGKVTRTEYNTLGKKSSLIKPDGQRLNYEYDACGRLFSLKSSDGSISYLYSYNRNDQPAKVGDLIADTITEHIYDSLGQLVKEKLANGLEIGYSYDRMGRCCQTHLPDNSTIEQQYDACYLKEIGRGGKQSLSMKIAPYPAK